MHYVAVPCRVLKIARQPYYRWLADPVADAEWTQAHRANALHAPHVDDPAFGHRLLADEARKAGQGMADRTAWRICSQLGWWSAFGKKRGRNGKKPGPLAHEDLVELVLAATGPNQLWFTESPWVWWRLSILGRMMRVVAAPWKYSVGLQARASRMAMGARGGPRVRAWGIKRVADQMGVGPEALRTWVRQGEIDGGARAGATTDDASRLAPSSGRTASCVGPTRS